MAAVEKDSFIASLPESDAAALAQAGYQTAIDILLHFPLRFENWRDTVPVAELRQGETALVEGTLTEVKVQPIRGRGRHLLAILEDTAGGQVTLRFFRVTSALQWWLYAGRRLRARGAVRLQGRGWEMAHPRLQPVDKAGSVVTIYPALGKLNPDRIRRLITNTLAQADLSPTVADCRDRFDGGEWTLKQALTAVHTPPAEESAVPAAWRRLRFEELLAHQILLRRRYRLRQTMPAPSLSPPNGCDEFNATLPFMPTDAQQRAVREIAADLAASRPMRRLLQGDVGSGKTVVAACACWIAVKSGKSAAFMVPTEILAEQHYQSLSSLLGAVNIHCELLTGAMTGKQRSEAEARLRFGISQVVIGTHTLFQERFALPSLALAVIDEQHRFGVEQRRALVDKGVGVHQLMMSATPIPRTLALSMFADMDISVLDEKPPGRRPVQTVLINGDRRREVLTRAGGHIEKGGRVYWVCPLVEEAEDSTLSDVHSLVEEVNAVLPDIGARAIHGRMKAAEKKAVMDEFRRGDFGLLAATTVIEVGVDVPQADVMVIEHADRMGLSQLHQLRGRVGRGERPGICLLMYQAPLSAEAKERLHVMRATTDGFEIARRDLIMRGSGDWSGQRQSGLPPFRVARWGEDEDIVRAAREVAEQMLREDEEVCRRHVRRWLGRALDDDGDG